MPGAQSRCLRWWSRGLAPDAIDVGTSGFDDFWRCLFSLNGLYWNYQTCFLWHFPWLCQALAMESTFKYFQTRDEHQYAAQPVSDITYHDHWKRHLKTGGVRVDQSQGPPEAPRRCAGLSLERVTPLFCRVSALISTALNAGSGHPKLRFNECDRGNGHGVSRLSQMGCMWRPAWLVLADSSWGLQFARTP